MNRLYLLIFVILYLINLNSGATFTCDPTASCGCSISSTNITERVVGGQAAADSAWGWALQLLYYGSERCTAVLITPEYALTAAHCLNYTVLSELSIIAGTNYLYDPTGVGQHRQVTGYYIHPNFNGTLDTYDVGIIHFSPLTLSSSVKPICLPAAGVDPFTTGSNVVAVGWGVTSEGSNQVSSTLQQVTVQVESSTSADCIRAPISDPSVQLCAAVSGGGKDTCQGDSGGPLMAFTNNQWVLAGLTSSGDGCARAGYPGIYTRISFFVSFIDYITQIAGVSTGTTTQATSRAPPIAAVGAGNNAINLGQFSYQLICFLLFSLFISIKM